MHRIFRNILLLLVPIFMVACSEEQGSWENVAKSIPQDADLVISVNSSCFNDILGKIPGLDKALELGPAKGLLSSDIEHVLVVSCSMPRPFITWPVTNTAGADEIISQWTEVSLGDAGDARACATSSSIIVATPQQVWFIPETTDIDTAVGDLKRMFEDISHDSDTQGLLNNPVAMAVITSTPKIAEAYACQNKKMFTATIAESADDYNITILRKNDSGASIPLSDKVLQPDTAAFASPKASVSVLASFTAGSFGNFASTIVNPLLTMKQRLALQAVSSILADAEGNVSLRVMPLVDGHLPIELDLEFSSPEKAEHARAKLLSLTEGRVSNLSISIQGKLLSLRTSVYWDDALGTPLCNSASLRATVFPYEAQIKISKKSLNLYPFNK